MGKKDWPLKAPPSRTEREKGRARAFLEESVDKRYPTQYTLGPSAPLGMTVG